MSLQLFIAHTGESLRADPATFSTLDALRTWIARTTSVPAQRQILMNAQGKQVRLQTLSNETEIFVYDRQYLIPPSTETLNHPAPTIAVPPAFSPGEAPDTLSSQNNLEAWQKLFMKRRAWAIDVVATCDFMTVSTQRSYGEITNIRRGVAVAVDNLRMHVGSLEQKFGEAKAWVGDVVQEHAGVVEHCEATLSRLDSLPAQGDFLPFLEVTSSTPDGSRLPRSTQEVATLKGFVSVEDVQKAASLGHNVAQQFRSRLSELGVIVQRIFSDSQNLASSVDKDVTRPVGDGDEVGQLMSDVELVARKISTDYEHVLGLQSSPKAVSQASKMALSHTRNYLPALRDRSMDISQHLRAAAEEKNTSATSAVGNMQTISAIESMLANVHQQLSTLALSPENTKAFEVLDFVEHLPAVYSALLVESVRRREWREKMTVDSSTLAEEMAMYKEEETRRRKKWLKGMHNHLNLDVADTTSLAIEVNLQGEENEWPYVTRDTLSKFFEKLKAAGGMEDAAKSLSQMLKDLDAPTRQQTRRANAFKNGSVYDAGFGRSSLLLRGDDDVLRALKDDKSRLEDRLKSSDSRVRKLEDLLHRQSQSNRTSNGSDFHLAGPHGLEQPSSTINQPSSAFATRPQGIPSRKSSVSSRRYSSNQGPEDRTLVQRIVSLEADLASEKEQSATLRNEVFARNNSDHEHKQQMEEIVSTKRDLLDNLEAQQREFDDERRLLEDDTSKLKLRLEELEDELDRVLGSRDNEKLGTDEKVSTLERELGQLRKDAAEEAQKAQGQIDYLRQDYTMQREKANKLEKQKQLNDGETRRLQERIQLLEGRLRAHDDSRRDHQAALHMAHHSLSPDGAIPDGFTALVESIEYLAQRSSTKTKDLEQTMSIIRADNELLTTRLQDVEAELLSTREKLGTKETETISLGESLAEEKAKYNALMAELEDERLQLNTLRIKFAVGETGSGTLKDRIAEEESKVTDLSEELASTKSIVHSLEKELSAAQGKLKEAQTDQSSTYARLETRGVRAKEIMQKLHTYTECINGLLEYLGYSVTSENGSTTIQRVPRTLGASTTLVDPASSMNRTLSGPLPTRHSSETPPDLDLLYWMHCEDPNIEAEKFAAFLDKTGRFDVDAFSEAIIKRVKETEHMARKWQKEARAYRDKSHRAQSEAHEKIAFRSFKEGDLALFLPTRNQATRPWAAFNVGAPHYFLREQDSHKLRTRDWLLARISKVEERVVDLSKSINGLNNQAGNDIDGRSIGEANSDGGASVDDENPFELSDGLRWYLLDAAEEKPGAPTTPGLAKTTVASAHVDVKGSIRTMKKSTNGNGGASKTLSKSLDSRRSSTASRKGVSPSATCLPSNGGGGSGEPSRTNTATSAAPPDTPRTPAAAAVVLAPKEAEDKNPTRTDTDEGGRSQLVHLRQQSETSPSKNVDKEKPKSRAWGSLWSLDLSLESGKNRR